MSYEKIYGQDGWCMSDKPVQKVGNFLLAPVVSHSSSPQGLMHLRSASCSHASPFSGSSLLSSCPHACPFAGPCISNWRLFLALFFLLTDPRCGIVLVRLRALLRYLHKLAQPERKAKKIKQHFSSGCQRGCALPRAVWLHV